MQIVSTHIKNVILGHILPDVGSLGYQNSPRHTPFAVELYWHLSGMKGYPRMNNPLFIQSQRICSEALKLRSNILNIASDCYMFGQEITVIETEGEYL